jgi:protein-tyrosine phosphatase
MDGDNLANVETLRPAGNETPVRVLTDYISGGSADHVPDPYYTRDFDGALDLIEEAVQGLKAALA